MNGLGGVLAAVLPSIGVGVLFWFAMRAIINADRTERQALARMDREAADAEKNAGPVVSD
ncbi:MULTISPECIES: hypothetical protein [Cellulomonas]|uniref:Uncharacterized protein n=1 Tax=Cellulomonas gilvus (strain ATCC 13127 / NRRL B-14078) TaxID=593907 RepID=F8A4T1_CELGA|nr:MULTISPECIES: hypothetical protein [Cellulomonas]AEI10897.1 hypothetical protein Celgi_0375 [Cellulomonas gilvus ATCC 13127]MCR6688250.1 hypothetical protein [Cellulomonas sp.]